MQLVILAGGRGTRMGDLTREVPKPMVPIAGKPILEHQIELARRHGVTDITLLTGHMGDVIRDFFGEGGRWGVKIRYHQERVPLGTAGAVRELQGQIGDEFLVFYGDTVMDVDLEALIGFHRSKGGMATLLVHPNDHPYDSDLLEADEGGRVTAFYRKPHPEGVYLRNLVSAALYVFSPEVLDHVVAGEMADFGRDIFPALVSGGHELYAYNTPEFIKDVGTPERLGEVEQDILSGRVARLNLRNKRPAVFLDRDGVLNMERAEHVRRPEDLELLPGVAEAIKRINQSDYLAVVVTNQPHLAKGFGTEEELNAVHGKLDTLLGESGAYIDRLYYCPHHPEKGFEGERAELKIECDCRKPGTGMIDRAVGELNIDLGRSLIIGDRTVDTQTGINAGVATVLVRTGFGGGDGKYACDADFVFDDLGEAVEFVLKSYEPEGTGPGVGA